MANELVSREIIPQLSEVRAKVDEMIVLEREIRKKGGQFKQRGGYNDSYDVSIAHLILTARPRPLHIVEFNIIDGKLQIGVANTEAYKATLYAGIGRKDPEWHSPTQCLVIPPGEIITCQFALPPNLARTHTVILSGFENALSTLYFEYEATKLLIAPTPEPKADEETVGKVQTSRNLGKKK